MPTAPISEGATRKSGSHLTIDFHSAMVLAVLMATLGLKLLHLDHAHLKPADEAFHAVVARNLLRHPLSPTLYERPWLDANDSDWQAAHLWLHKPPMALWQIGLFFWLFGVHPLVLRLPSVFLSTGAAWMTYRIGCGWINRGAGAIAAILQATSPILLMLVHGYIFSDHVDIALLFWVECGVLAIVGATRASSDASRFRWAFAGGIGQGLAFLTKSYPAGAVTLVAIACAALSDRRFRFPPRALLMFFVGAVCGAGPYLAYAAITSPNQFANAYLTMLGHVTHGVEGFGAPWDRLWFDYAAGAFYVFYVLALTSAVWFTLRSWRDRDRPRVVVAMWAAAVFCVMTLTANKTATATIIAWPAVFLMMGAALSAAWKGRRSALAICFAGLLVAVVYPGRFNTGTIGYPPGSGFALVARQQVWIIVECVAAVVIALVTARLLRFELIVRIVKWSVLVATVWLMIAPPMPHRVGGYLESAIAVTRLDRESNDIVSLGAFAARLPENAALFLQLREKSENILLMFYADRSVYPLPDADPVGADAMIRTAEHRGALPYIVTAKFLPLPVVFSDAGDRKIYAASARALEAARP